jgi:prolyl oligopeptidase
MPLLLKFSTLFTGVIFSLQLSAQWSYPPTKTVDSSSSYFGVTYKDPYRWLENLKDDAVNDWFKQQSILSDHLLQQITGRKELVNDWRKYDRATPPEITRTSFKNGRLFYCKLNPGDKVAKAYYRQGINGKETLLFDPAKYIKGKTFSISNILPSNDGAKLGITYTEMGREISTVRVLDVNSKTFLPGKIYPSWEGMTSWTADSKAFTYLLLKSDDVTSPDIGLGNQTRACINWATIIKMMLTCSASNRTPN